jgi:hypothetical protein
MDQTDAVRARYARFARDEVQGRSALYTEWAAGVAADPVAAAVLARIPETRRQPPLVFAVTRLLGAPEQGYADWARWLAAHADAVVRECGRRSVQTNEPLRCAALLPALSRIPGPIALLEVGASAGLCLYPDRYSYRYRHPDGTTTALDPADGPSAVVLESAASRPLPPLALPDVVWRAGVDLAPLDPRDPDDRAWLTTLVWPGETGRADRVRAALDVAAADPPLLRRGDARDGIAALAAEAPAGATLVVTTPGVLAHVPRAGRAVVAAAARSAGRWITLDAPALHDEWATPPGTDWPEGAFALALDGRILAAADPLGRSVEWRAGADADPA